MNKDKDNLFSISKILNQNEFRVFVIAIIVSLAAKGASLFPISYSSDDFFATFSSRNFDWFVGDGRFGWALLSELTYIIGAAPPFTNTFYTLLYMISLVIVGIIVCRIWRINDSMVLSTLVVLFISIHPYQAELFSFKVNALYNALSIFFAYIGLYYSELKLKTVLWTSFCVVVALSIYQISLSLIFTTLCLALVLEVPRQYTQNTSINWREIINNTKLWPRLITICSGTGLYLVINKAIQYVLHISPSDRFQFIHIENILPRLIEIKNVLIRIFILPEPLMPISLKIMLIILILLAVYFYVGKIFSKSLNKSTIVNLSVLTVLFIIATLSIIGVTSAIKSWWPVPRSLSAISFFWGGMIALAYITSGEKIRLLVVSLSIFVLFGFIGINNHIFTDQLRLNMRDFHKANRIIARMENNPDFTKIQRIAVVGGNWYYPSAIHTVEGDMNISAFSQPWSKISILKEISGYDFAYATPDEQKKAEEYCRGTLKWPEPGSVIISGNLCIVCL